jgi:hypothetical protein
LVCLLSHLQRKLCGICGPTQHWEIQGWLQMTCLRRSQNGQAHPGSPSLCLNCFTICCSCRRCN